MARVKKIKKKETKEGIEHREVWVDTKTGKEYPAPESVRTTKEFEEIRKLPEPKGKEALIAAARERERLPPALPKAEAAVELEAAGAFEEVTPSEVSLQPEKRRGEEIPLLGPVLGATAELPAGEQSLLGVARRRGWIGEKTTGEEAFTIPETPETLREEALREIRKKSFEEDISMREAVGSLIEGIPIVGSLARKFANGLIETPSANADNVLGEINKLKEAASTGQEKVRNGLEDPGYGLDRARNMEADIAKLEGRIQLLIITSPILRANADEVNKIQEEILEAKEKVARYRQASEFGLTAQLTGTGRIIPTDEQLYFELERLKGSAK